MCECNSFSLFVLLACVFVFRKNLLDSEEISKTQLACAWSSTKGSVQEKYQCIQEMPCIKPKIPPVSLNVSDELRNSMFEFFIEKLPNSAIAKHRKGRHIVEENTSPAASTCQIICCPLQKIIDNSAQSILLMNLSSDKCSFPHPCCKVLYDSILNEDVYEMLKLDQNSLEWYNARSFRITGSRCYEIYTYHGADWENKSKKYFWPKSFTNKFVKHGLKYEGQARAAFVSKTGHNVVECGMIISPQNKWLGFSPDGVVVDSNGRSIGLLEIKCLYAVNKLTDREKTLWCNSYNPRSC